MSIDHSGDGLNRRRVLTGASAGAAALAGLMVATATPAFADSAGDSAATTSGNAADATQVPSTLASAPVSGLVYRHASMFDFVPENFASGRGWGGYGAFSPSGTVLWASVDIPSGARVRDIEWYAYNTSGNPISAAGRIWAAGTGTLSYLAVDVPISSGSGIRAFRASVPSDNYGPFPLGSKLMLGFPAYNAGATQVNGARVGFSQAAGAIGMLPSPVRAYDSRQVGGLLSAGTTRTVTLPTSVCPVGTTGLVVNLIAVSAEKTGYLRMWPGHVSDTDTSAVNYTKGTTLANAQVVGVSAARQIKLRSSAKMHVVIDVIGTIG